MIYALGKKGEAAGREGGGARWLKRRDPDYIPGAPDDQARFRLGEDGCIEGWAAEAVKWKGTLSSDAEGFVCAGGRRLTVAEADRLPPAMRLAARARLTLGDDVPTLPEHPPMRIKISSCHIRAAAAAKGLEDVIDAQCRFGFTAAFSSDGTWRMVKTEKDGLRRVAARAAVRHDGLIIGGVLEEEEGEDNYLAELAAMLDVLASLPPGGRILLIFDATSPVIAMRSFKRRSNRAKANHYVGRWLAELDRLINLQEVVFFRWQTSHVGAPINEAADQAAHAMAEGQVVAIPRACGGFASLRFPEFARGPAIWASPRAAALVRRRLGAASVHTQFRDVGDINLSRMPDRMERMAAEVRSARVTFADDARCLGAERKAIAARIGCKGGCREPDDSLSTGTWHHNHFKCQLPDLVALRRKHLACVEIVQDLLSANVPALDGMLLIAQLRDGLDDLGTPDPGSRRHAD